MCPHPRHALSPSLFPQAPFSFLEPAPTSPQAVPQYTGTETGLSPCRASNSVVSPADCPVSGMLKWLPPFLSSQAFLHAGMTRPHVLPWGSHQSLDRKLIHRYGAPAPSSDPFLSSPASSSLLLLLPLPSSNLLVLSPPYMSLPPASSSHHPHCPQDPVTLELDWASSRSVKNKLLGTALRGS